MCVSTVLVSIMSTHAWGRQTTSKVHSRVKSLLRPDSRSGLVNPGQGPMVIVPTLCHLESAFNPAVAGSSKEGVLPTVNKGLMLLSVLRCIPPFGHVRHHFHWLAERWIWTLEWLKDVGKCWHMKHQALCVHTCMYSSSGVHVL